MAAKPANAPAPKVDIKDDDMIPTKPDEHKLIDFTAEHLAVSTFSISASRSAEK